MEKIATHKRSFGPFGGIYYGVRSLDSVWRNVLNHRAVKELHAWSPVLSQKQKEIIATLREDGIAITHIDDLWPSENKLEVLSQYTNRLIDKAETKTNKSFLEQMWDTEPVLDFENPFVQFALDSKILAIVSNYLSVMARFYYLTLNVTKPVVENSAPVQSQRWHRDPEDVRTCKVFLYLNDVPETAGPFIYVKGSHRGGKWGKIFPQKPPRGCYPDEQALLAVIPPSDIVTATGKKGSLIFCDTAGLHKGGYATKDKRIMFTAGYCTDASVWPLRFVRPKEIDAIKERLSQEARYALEYKK